MLEANWHGKNNSTRLQHAVQPIHQIHCAPFPESKFFAVIGGVFHLFTLISLHICSKHCFKICTAFYFLSNELRASCWSRAFMLGWWCVVGLLKKNILKTNVWWNEENTRNFSCHNFLNFEKCFLLNDFCFLLIKSLSLNALTIAKARKSPKGFPL